MMNANHCHCLALLDEGDEMEMSWATPTQFRTDDSCLFSSNSQVIRSVNKLFFRLRPLPSHHSPQFPSFSCVFAFALFYYTIFRLHMALTRIPLPSFTLVLTSDPQSLHGYPTAIKLDSSSSPAMRPTARDHLMVTTYLAVTGGR